MRDPERRKGEEPEEAGTRAYLYLALGIGLLVGAAMIVSTAGVLAAGFPFVIGAAALIGLGVNEFRKQNGALPRPVDKERELLSAIRDNGGSITPAEAAMETSLTIREADEMLSGLAGEGHLQVASEDGALVYALPKRESRELN